MFREGTNFFTRHSQKIKGGLEESEKYKGLTPAGVELAKKTATEGLKPIIDSLPPDAVMAILGGSDAVRTKSTAQIYGDALAELYQDDKNTVVITKEQIADPEKSYLKIVKGLEQEIADNPDKKFVINFPLFIKEFSMKGRWTDEKGNLSPFTNKLLEAANQDDNQAVIKWVESQGEIDGIKGPNPTEVAQAYKQGFDRLREFATKHAPGRPVFVGGAEHSWDLDVFIAYMTHGKVDPASLRQIMGAEEKMIQETEPFYFRVEPDKIVSRYRGQDYEFALTDEN